ncbi:MAG TPA: ABC transporter transmembrane domain-containing protein, partial [Pontiella sp.]|nr:ABC transporter transmembrane domain-containing protein [Pontiella sp.]
MKASEEMSRNRKYSDWVLLKRLLRMGRPYIGRILLIFIIGLLAAPLTLLLPIPLKIVVDSVLGKMPLPKTISFLVPASFAESSSALLLFAVIMQVLVILLLHFQQVAMHILQTYTGQKLILKLRQKLFGHIQRLSFAFHDARGTADSIYRIQYDATSIEQILVYGSVAFISSFVTLVAMIYVIMRLNVQLALIALAVLPVLYVLSRRFSTRMRSKYKQVKKMESHVLGIVQEVMGAFRVVKAFNREATEERRFSTQAEDTIKLHMSLAFAESSYGLLVNGTVALGSAGVLYVGVHHIMAGTLSIGELLMVLTYLTQLYNPLKTISKKLAALQKNLASAQRAFELLDEDPDVKDKPDAVGIKRAGGEIVFNNLFFSYDGRTTVLKNISLHIKAGTRLGIAGETGAGKTTL